MHCSKRQLAPSPLVIRLCRNDFLNRESQVRFLPGARGEIVEIPGSGPGLVADSSISSLREAPSGNRSALGADSPPNRALTTSNHVCFSR
jgi:hypothetical protein